MARFCAYILFVFLFATNTIAFALPKPVLSCISVISNNSVIAYWETPSPSSDYDGFRLYYKKVGQSTSNSIDISDIAATSVVVNISDISTSKYEFFLVTLKSGVASDPSATVQNILLDVAGLGTGIARLEWNPVSNSDSYRVTRSIDKITFVEYNTITSSDQLIKHNDTINGICDVTKFYYRIESLNCNNAYSNIDSATLRDQDTPNDPKVTIVTVKNDGNDNFYTEIQWEHSTSYDVDHYTVELFEGTGTPVGNAGYSTMFVINDPAHPAYISPCSAPIQYIVRAVDRCGNGSSGSVNYIKPQNTIYLKGDVSAYCERRAYLEWNSYKNMDPPLKEYLIERSQGGPFEVIERIPASDSASYQFLDSDMLEPGVEARYRIAAVSTDERLKSHSCEYIVIPYPVLVNSFEITNVTVTEDENVQITVEAAPAAVPHEMALYRTSGEGYVAQDTVLWDPSGVMQVVDADGNTSSVSYTYYAVALDECGNGVAYSDEFNSILLKLKAEDERMELSWQPHKGWGDDFSEYLLYKYINDTLITGYPIHTSSALYVEFDDSDTFEEVTYAVEAVNKNGTIPTSRSNVVLIPKAGAIQVPTAFNPESENQLNQTFRPDVRNVDPSTYKFTIYSKWGEKVFETTDIDSDGWNGQFNGSKLSGIFTWVVSYRDQQGASDTHRGNVIIVR